MMRTRPLTCTIPFATPKVCVLIAANHGAAAVEVAKKIRAAKTTNLPWAKAYASIIIIIIIIGMIAKKTPKKKSTLYTPSPCA